MRTCLALTTLMLVASVAAADVVFSDDFSSDLSQWTPNHEAFVGSNIAITDNGELSLDGPNGNNWPYQWDAYVTSNATFTDAGEYTLSFRMWHDSRGSDDLIRARMPGGLEMRWDAWSNDGKLYYQDTKIADISNGNRVTWKSFKLVQDGTSVAAYMEDTLLYEGTVSSDPDFGTYDSVRLYSKFYTDNPTLFDDVTLGYVPEPATVSLLVFGGAVTLIKRRNR